MSLKEDAAEVLHRAYAEALEATAPICQHKNLIDTVIDNTHLTFKYILFTEILSKATDSKINTLCLQKHSELPGAYDARTVCHKVIVPFEMETLDKVLGGSNEPFLNKPARFPELAKTNAVRRGNDQMLLNCLCDNLPTITTSDDAYQCLVYLLHKLIGIRNQQRCMQIFTVPEDANLPIRLYNYIDRALENSYEGEVLTLVVAGIYHLMFPSNNVLVEVHPVNQCGASGREVSDLDIYVDGVLFCSNELKDKDYTETDVRHAADKVIATGGTRMLFIEGPRANSADAFEAKLINEYAERNFFLRIIPCDVFFSTTISMIERIDCHEFMRFILTSAHETKFKEEVISYMDTLAQYHLGLSR